MRCLSLKQPFADMVVDGKKTIELRKWNTHFRGRFIVHASGTVDRYACSVLGIDPGSLIKKAAIGEATLVDVKKYENLKEFEGDREKHRATDAYRNSVYGFILKAARRFRKPVAMKGRLGFFETDIRVP